MIAACYILLFLCLFAGITHTRKSAAKIATVFVAFNVIGAIDPLSLYQYVGNIAVYIFDPLYQSSVDNIFERAKFVSTNAHLIVGAFFIVYLFPSSRYYKRVLWLIVAGVFIESASLILWEIDKNYGLLNVAYNIVALYVIYDRDRRGNIISSIINRAVHLRHSNSVGSYKWKA